MSPGVLTRETPCLTASPLLGSTSPAYPSGIASETPVPTTARPPGLSSAPSAARRSYPASPACALSGTRAPGPGRRHATPPGPAGGPVPARPGVRPVGDPGVGHEAAESYAQGSFGRHTAGHVSTRARGGQPDRGEGARGAGALAPEAFTKLVVFAPARQPPRA